MIPNLRLKDYLLIALLLLTCWCFSPSPAFALLRQHHESPGVLRYHAQQSIQDQNGSAWQVVLFPKAQEEPVTTYNLRLVAFPGAAKFRHPQPLEITLTTGEILIARDVFTQEAPAPNVGQFNFMPILPYLPQKQPLQLHIALQNNQNLTLDIPYSIQLEWQFLSNI